jgi:ribosomal protein L14E/L6E/L27E
MGKRAEHRIIEGVEGKDCYRCGRWYPLDAYTPSNINSDHLLGTCKSCNCERSRIWRSKHPEYPKNYGKKYQAENKEKIREHGKIYRANNKEKLREAFLKWRTENYDKYLLDLKRWRENHKDVARVHNKKANAKRRATAKGALNHRISNLIRLSIKRGNKNCSWVSLVGYSLDELRTHLERTMPDGYSWQDFVDGNLHIDHIIPQSAFNYELPSDVDFKRCWALRNLRLLPAIENIRKYNRVDYPFQPSLVMAI